ncbi:MAG: hypothetical protein KC925_01440 [Candidatus Doudnabacteria bacterium]|nr:hypothetical protein [Candidatus Doudnabacteria bacterium]
MSQVDIQGLAGLLQGLGGALEALKSDAAAGAFEGFDFQTGRVVRSVEEQAPIPAKVAKPKLSGRELSEEIREAGEIFARAMEAARAQATVSAELEAKAAQAEGNPAVYQALVRAASEARDEAGRELLEAERAADRLKVAYKAAKVDAAPVRQVFDGTMDATLAYIRSLAPKGRRTDRSEVVAEPVERDPVDLTEIYAREIEALEGAYAQLVGWVTNEPQRDAEGEVLLDDDGNPLMVVEKGLWRDLGFEVGLVWKYEEDDQSVEAEAWRKSGAARICELGMRVEAFLNTDVEDIDVAGSLASLRLAVWDANMEVLRMRATKSSRETKTAVARQKAWARKRDLQELIPVGLAFLALFLVRGMQRSQRLRSPKHQLGSDDLRLPTEGTEPFGHAFRRQLQQSVQIPRKVELEDLVQAVFDDLGRQDNQGEVLEAALRGLPRLKGVSGKLKQAAGEAIAWFDGRERAFKARAVFLLSVFVLRSVHQKGHPFAQILKLANEIQDRTRQGLIEYLCREADLDVDQAVSLVTSFTTPADADSTEKRNKLKVWQVLAALVGGLELIVGEELTMGSRAWDDLRKALANLTRALPSTPVSPKAIEASSPDAPASQAGSAEGGTRRRKGSARRQGAGQKAGSPAGSRTARRAFTRGNNAS